MTWTLSWFDKQKGEWERRAHQSADEHMPGHKCYAEKQVIMWKKMHDVAAEKWNSIL